MPGLRARFGPNRRVQEINLGPAARVAGAFYLIVTPATAERRHPRSRLPASGNAESRSLLNFETRMSRSRPATST